MSLTLTGVGIPLPDVADPTLLSATIEPDGVTLTLVWSESVAEDVGTVSVDTVGDATFVSSAFGVATYTITAVIAGALTLDAEEDSVVDLAGHGNAAISNRSITNNSELTVPEWTVDPVVTGTATSGQTLTSTAGTVTGNPTPTTAYVWKRCDNANGTGNVTTIGANQNTYVLTGAEVGKYVFCARTATNSVGSDTANSNVVGPIGA